MPRSSSVDLRPARHIFLSLAATLLGCGLLMGCGLFIGCGHPPSSGQSESEGHESAGPRPRVTHAMDAESTPTSGPRLQSPIDLPAEPPTAHEQHQIKLRYHETTEHLIHRDHTIELEFDPGSELEFDGRHYLLDQLHFHTPSEHLVGHKRFPVELHFVHHDEDRRLLVLGVLFDVGAANPFVERIISDAPEDLGRIDLDRHLDVGELFPPEQHFYAYQGSLTTAPYSGDVQWLILSEHPTVSHEQIVRLLLMEGGNARDVQPVNDRSIEAID